MHHLHILEFMTSNNCANGFINVSWFAQYDYDFAGILEEGQETGQDAYNSL